MKSTQMPLIKTIVDQMVSESLSINKDPAKHIPVIQRVSTVGDRRYVQLITTVGVIAVLDDHKLVEDSYPIVDVGYSDKWSKISKGVVVSSAEMEVPFQTAANASVIADEAVSYADMLLHSPFILPPITSITHPGNAVVTSAADGKSLTWIYHSAASNAGDYTNMLSEWTKSPQPVEPYIYGVIRGWHRAVVYSFPKDKETGQPTKLDGVTLSRLGNVRNMLYIVSRELGICAALACSHLLEDTTVSYTDIRGVPTNIVCKANGFYNTKENSNMNVKMVDVTALTRKPVQGADKETVAATAPPEPVVERTAEQVTPPIEPVAPVSAISEVSQPVSDNCETEESPSPVANTQESVAVSADEALATILQTVTELGTALRGVPADLRNVRKLYKTEQKDAKAVAKLVAEIDKLKAERDSLKSRLDKCTAELKKWQSIGNSIKSLTIPED